MDKKFCRCCGQEFLPRPQVVNQAFCSQGSCQRERRQAWQRQKILEDQHYRENQRDAQRAWRERNPDYPRQYRTSNSKSTKPKTWSQKIHHENVIDKVTENIKESPISDQILDGIYRVRLIKKVTNGKTDAWIAEISPLRAIATTKNRRVKRED